MIIVTGQVLSRRILLFVISAAAQAFDALASNARPWDNRKRMPIGGTPEAPVLPRIVLVGGTGRIGSAVDRALPCPLRPVRRSPHRGSDHSARRYTAPHRRKAVRCITAGRAHRATRVSVPLRLNT